MSNYNMRGVRFLTDCKGKKTGAFVDLKEHSAFWEDVLAECGEPTDFQFLVDEEGKPIAVLLEFDQHIDLWEDVYDILAIELAKDEPRIPWEEVEHQIMEKGKLNV